MKIISNNLITAVTATSENSKYPASFLLDGHPSMPWRAVDGVHQARLTFNIAAGTTGLAIFGTNATRAVCNLSNPQAFTWLNVDWLNVEWQRNSIPTKVSIVEMNNGKAVWVDFGVAVDVAFNADVTLTNPDETIYGGCVVGAAIESFRDPALGMSQRRESRSVFIEMNNAAFYGHKVNNLKAFSGTVVMTIDDWDRLEAIAKDMDIVDPAAWKFTDEDNNRWVIFARFTAMPAAQYIGNKMVSVSISIIEVL